MRNIFCLHDQWEIRVYLSWFVTENVFASSTSSSHSIYTSIAWIQKRILVCLQTISTTLFLVPFLLPAPQESRIRTIPENEFRLLHQATPKCCLAQHSNLALGHGSELRSPAPLRCGEGKGHPEQWGRRWLHAHENQYPGREGNLVNLIKKNAIEAGFTCLAASALRGPKAKPPRITNSIEKRFQLQFSALSCPFCCSAARREHASSLLSERNQRTQQVTR